MMDPIQTKTAAICNIVCDIIVYTAMQHSVQYFGVMVIFFFDGQHTG